MNKLIEFVTLKVFKGSRTQITVAVAAILNLLVNFGIVQLSPEQMKSANEVLVALIVYFFADKVDGLKEIK